MTGRWSEVKPVFEAVRGRPPEDRAALLDKMCGGDPWLRAEVESLMRWHETSSPFLETPPYLHPLHLGAYRVVKELGRGGMGVTYLAERADEQFEKEVAIKAVHAAHGLGDHFRRERQILAELEHENITRLLDGGSDGDLQYMVMECVQGAPIDQYCEDERLGLREKIGIFLGVCGAVHYAHQRLVIHCDIKPGNILVTREGVPKLLDFGIARLCEASEKGTTRTRSLLTPAYASPEQIRGERLTTATDIYSLGATLFRMLSGRVPFDAPAHELSKLICDAAPPRPSSLAAGAGVRRQLRGDLDAIVLRAMRKDPQSRYATVQELMDDLRRYLEGKPVSARRGTLGYIAGRFARRRWRLLATAAALLVAILYSAEQTRKASERRDAIREVADLAMQSAELRGIEFRAKLMQQTMNHLLVLASEPDGNGDVLRDASRALIQVSGYSQHLNEWNAALESARESARLLRLIRRPVLEDRFSMMNADRIVARCLYRSGRSAAAIEMSTPVQREMEKLWEEHPRIPESAFLLLQFASERSQMLESTGDSRGAVALAHRARQFPREVSRGWTDAQSRFAAAHGYLWLSDLLARSGERDAAADLRERSRWSVTALEMDGSLSPASRASMHGLRSSHFEREVNIAAAIAARREELRLREQGVAVDPNERYSVRMLAECRIHLAKLLHLSGNERDVIPLLEAAYRTLEQFGVECQDVEWTQLAGLALQRMAESRLRQGEPVRARTAAMAALKIRESLAGKDPGNATFQKEAAESRAAVLRLR